MIGRHLYWLALGAVGFLVTSEQAVAATSVNSIARPASFEMWAFFSAFFVLTIGICVWAARRSHSTDEYLAAGNSITPTQNGFAIAGDYMSAGAFLGLTGAMYSSGLDGFFLAATYLASWPVVLFLVAEPLRKLGRYSLADVLASRVDERPIRILCAICSLTIISFYLVAQLVGAGELFGLLVGAPYRIAVGVAGAMMIAFAVFGGRRRDTLRSPCRASRITIRNQRMSLERNATAIACPFVTAPSFPRAEIRCFATVGLEMPKIVAISQSVLPSAAQRRHSVSRAVREAWVGPRRALQWTSFPTA